MLKTFVLALLVALALGRTYPMYKQCDARWANEQLGTSSNTICKAGCAMSSLAMGLAGTGHNYNPSSLNQWLKGNGGYVSGDLLVWGSVTRLGLTLKEKFQTVKSNQNSTKEELLSVTFTTEDIGFWLMDTVETTFWSMIQVTAPLLILFLKLLMDKTPFTE